MPELPEVETYVRGIAGRLRGRTFQNARLSHDDVLRGVTRRRLLSRLRGARVLELFRRAKHEVIVTDRGIIANGLLDRLLVLTDRLDDLSGLVGDLTNQVDNLLDQLTRLAERVEDLRDLDRVIDRVDRLIDRIDRILGRL